MEYSCQLYHSYDAYMDKVKCPKDFDKIALQVVAVFSLMRCLDGQGNVSTRL